MWSPKVIFGATGTAKRARSIWMGLKAYLGHQSVEHQRSPDHNSSCNCWDGHLVPIRDPCIPWIKVCVPQSKGRGRFCREGPVLGAGSVSLLQRGPFYKARRNRSKPFIRAKEALFSSPRQNIGGRPGTGERDPSTICLLSKKKNNQRGPSGFQ